MDTTTAHRLEIQREMDIQRELQRENLELHQERVILLRRLEELQRNCQNEDIRNTNIFNRPRLRTKCIKKCEAKTDEHCPICLNENLRTKDMMWFQCNHAVCSSCITGLLKPVDCKYVTHNKCPLCRETIIDILIRYTRSDGTKSQIGSSDLVHHLLPRYCR